MAASLESQEPRVMFARLFTSCFHGRPERAPPSSSRKPHLPPESSGTESSDSDFHSRSSQRSLPRQLQNFTSQSELPTIPPPTLSTKDPDMPRAPRKTVNNAAAKSAAKPVTKPKAAKAPKAAKSKSKLVLANMPSAAVLAVWDELQYSRWEADRQSTQVLRRQRA